MKTILATILSFATALCFAQVYDDDLPCKKTVNPALKPEILAGEIGNLFMNNANNAHYASWASSMLMNSGTPPVILKTEDDMGTSKANYDAWTCYYSPCQVMDGNRNTCWAEGVSGDGIGEILIAKVAVISNFRIWNGFGKSDALFQANNRIRKAKVHVFVSTSREQAAQSGMGYGNIRLLRTYEIELQDVNKYQTVSLPGLVVPKAEFVNTFVAIEIISVYKGTKYSDTCITDIAG